MNVTSNSSSQADDNGTLVGYTWNKTELSVTPEYIFDRTDLRVLLFVLYTLVFCSCFFGNLMVIWVVRYSRRLKSTTNFFLANLAVADLFVGLFCVYQNLSIYVAKNWVLGDFVCKLYHFVHNFSYTASIFILAVICVERYFAIIHPIASKHILTPRRLRMVISAVWVMSALYSSPRFFWCEAVTVPLDYGATAAETICISHRKKYNSETFDLINFSLLYLTPLVVMLVLYTRIAITLWDSGKPLNRTRRGETRNLPPICHKNGASIRVKFHPTHSSSMTINGEEAAIMQVSICADGRYPQVPENIPVDPTGKIRKARNNNHCSSVRNYHVYPNPEVLRARRGVVRMLMIVVLTFALCNLPYHARKMWQYWSSGYKGSSNFSSLFTMSTMLLTFMNSGINPLLYAFLSNNFRKAMREMLLPLCSRRKESVMRRSSVRSTKMCTFTTNNDSG